MLGAEHRRPAAARRHRRIADQDDLLRADRRCIGARALGGRRGGGADQRKPGGGGERDAPHEKASPPLMSTLVPVRNAASSEARNATAAATSSGVPSRRSGVLPATAARPSGLEKISWKLVPISPGHKALTRMPCGPSSLARPRVKVITAPFEVA